MELSTKRIRELIACPQFGDDHYGEWGCLAYDQRKAILQLVETIDRQQAKIENLSTALEVTRDNLGDTREELNRAETENESLRSQVNRLQQYDEERDIRLHAKLTETARAEAIKKFAERLKANMSNIARMEYGGYTYFCVGYGLIDNLVKEMTEDKP